MSDTNPPPSETSRVLSALQSMETRVNERFDAIERNQKFQGMDVDLLTNAVQEILIELQLPSSAERIRQSIEKRHPKFTNGDADEKTPNTTGFPQ